ncbi:MAG: magnesium/cobalt transporter CorA [Hydrococcus sp. Prado102]|nr:magnesium/cobalt transporter CorA [Hydrococcus sp. Prado102]
MMRQPSNFQMHLEDNLFSYHFNQPGTIPGTIRVQPDAAQSEIALIDYNANQAVRLTNLTLENCAAYLDTESVSWVDVSGLGSQEVLQQLGKIFQLHPLVLEDIINVPQRPKVEDYEDRLLIITQMVVLKEEGEGFWLEQVSLVLGQYYLLTVQEEPTRDTFEPVRDRIRNNRGTIRQRGVDYLAYALWDTIIDGYFLALEAYGERLEALENEVAIRPTKQTLTKIYQIRRELLALRRAIWPQRDAINTIIRDECSLVSKDVRIYLRDCYDHAVQIIDVIETYRELASGLMDVYLSAVGNRMNEVMKLLTVISTIFIPLTFLAGIYGMNFNTDISPFNMPELNWYWGYPLFWVVTIAIAFGLSFFFWRRGWFSDTSTLKPR